MADIGYYAPHETRMLALQMAVEFINGGKAGPVYKTEEVLTIAGKFEDWLTREPTPGFIPQINE